MPTYHVEMMEGRTVEQKKKLVEAITRVSVEILGGQPDSVGHPDHRHQARELGHRRQALVRAQGLSPGPRMPASLAGLQARHGRALPLAAAAVGHDRHDGFHHVVDHRQRGDSRHEPPHFTLGQERAQWVSSGFMVAMTVSMLTTPWLLARYGYRRTYAGTMLLLMAGGIVGGLSNHFGLVLGARVAEGLAAGVVQPIPAIIIMRAFGPARAGPRQRPLRHGRGAGARHGAQHEAACWLTCSAGARFFSW